jgi:chromosome partitioning protein
MPSSPALDELHSKLESRYKIYKLRDALDALAPATTDLHRHAAGAELLHPLGADRGAGCLIPFDCDDFSRRALYACWRTCRRSRPTTTPA